MDGIRPIYYIGRDSDSSPLWPGRGKSGAPFVLGSDPSVGPEHNTDSDAIMFSQSNSRRADSVESIGCAKGGHTFLHPTPNCQFRHSEPERPKLRRQASSSAHHVDRLEPTTYASALNDPRLHGHVE